MPWVAAAVAVATTAATTATTIYSTEKQASTSKNQQDFESRLAILQAQNTMIVDAAKAWEQGMTAP